MSAALHHREQSLSNRCVPACASMVLSWLGRPIEEDELCRSWMGSERGFSLSDAAIAIGGTRVIKYPHEPSFHDTLRAYLVEPRWIIPYVFSAPLMSLTEAMSPPPQSRFGALSQAPFGELHTIVLTGADPNGYDYLDPYYPRTGQPFRLSNEQIVEVWQGAMVIAPAQPT